MAAEISLNCLILGLADAKAFPVDIPLSKTVGHLKKAIKEEKKDQLAHIDADQLDIWKLKEPLSNGDTANTLGKIAAGSEIPGADNLDPIKKLSHYFPKTPIDEVIHLIIQLPTPGQNISPFASLSSNVSEPSPPAAQWSPRASTVQILYQKLKHYKLMQVRGTPASGKTALSSLLYAYIQANEPQADVQFFTGWDDDGLSITARLKKNILNYPTSTTTYLIFDNGEDTYWDTYLWETFFKSQQFTGAYQIILFCGYGSAGTQPLSYPKGTPLRLDPKARVSLMRNSESADEFGSIGLLLSRAEFDEVVERAHEYGLDDSFKDMIFLWTGGHVGAVADILRITQTAARNAKCAGTLLGRKGFLETFSRERFFSELTAGSGWARGLPGDDHLGDPHVADIFRDMLQLGSIKGTDSSHSVHYCHKEGWIYSATANKGELVYVFPSPIHSLYFQWKLLPSSGPIPFTTPLELSIAVIRAFEPSRLSDLPRRVGDAGAVRPPEAAYQDEFYRSISKVTQGCVRVSSEYSVAEGACPSHIDFFIPSTMWGVQLLRDGHELEDWSHFRLGGAYGAWLKADDVMDYIILDFRGTRPQKSHNYMKKLYHVVFPNKDFKDVEILDGNLEKVVRFSLMGR